MAVRVRVVVPFILDPIQPRHTSIICARITQGHEAGGGRHNHITSFLHLPVAVFAFLYLRGMSRIIHVCLSDVVNPLGDLSYRIVCGGQHSAEKPRRRKKAPF